MKPPKWLAAFMGLKERHDALVICVRQLLEANENEDQDAFDEALADITEWMKTEEDEP